MAELLTFSLFYFNLKNKARAALHDVFVLWPQWIVHLTLVAVHCFITFYLPVTSDTAAECPIGYLGPAGLHLDGQHPSVCVGGAAGYIDRLLLSTQHIYNWPTARAVYNSAPYDPEGILGEYGDVIRSAPTHSFLLLHFIILSSRPN